MKILTPHLGPLLGLTLATPLLAQQPVEAGLSLSPALPDLTIPVSIYRHRLDPSTGVRTVELLPLSHYQDPAPVEGAEDGVVWKSAFNLGAMISTGNTRRRIANAAFEAERRSGVHRTTGKGAWNYAQQKATDNTSTGEYELEQRHTQGSLKQDYFIAEKSFLFAGVDAANDYDRNLALRFTATAGYGIQLIDEEEMQYSIEFGVGHYSEESRIAGVLKTDYMAGKVVSNLDKQLNDTWQLLNTITYLPSLEDGDELSGVCDTRLRAKMANSAFVQLQWIIEYDNTPLSDAAGNPNTRTDHQVFLSVGWTF